MARIVEAASFAPRGWRCECHRPLLWQGVSGATIKTRELEPWTELLDAARGGELLVGESFEWARRGRGLELPSELHPDLAEDRRATSAIAS